MSTSFLAPQLQRSTSRDKPALSPYRPIGTGYTPIGATSPGGGGGGASVNVGDPGFMAYHAGLVAQSGGEQSMGGSTIARKMKFQGGPFKGMTQAEAMQHAMSQWQGMDANQRGQFLPPPAGMPGLKPMPTMPAAPAPVPSAASAGTDANTNLLTAGLQAQRGLKPLTVADNTNAGPLPPGQGRQITVSGAAGQGSSTFKPLQPAPPAAAPVVASAPLPAPTGPVGPPVTSAPLPALKADNARQYAALPDAGKLKVDADMKAATDALPSKQKKLKPMMAGVKP